MQDTFENVFPEAFGISVEDFLRQYEALIYQIIIQHTLKDSRFEAEDLFQEFFIHLAHNHFMRLRCYRGECKPTTYIGKLLRNFLYDQYRKKEAKRTMESLDEMKEEKNVELPAPPFYPENIFDNELINEALKDTFSQLNQREKLMFDLFINEEMSAGEVSDFFNIKVKIVYKNNEKIKRILKKELNKRGIEDY